MLRWCPGTRDVARIGGPTSTRHPPSQGALDAQEIRHRPRGRGERCHRGRDRPAGRRTHDGRRCRGRPVHVQERADRRRRLRPRHHLQPDQTEPDLRAYRHRRRVPVGRGQPAAGSRCWTGWAAPTGATTAWSASPPTRSTPTRCTRPPACTPTAGTRTTAPSCARRTRAPPGRPRRCRSSWAATCPAGAWVSGWRSTPTRTASCTSARPAATACGAAPTPGSPGPR